MKKIIAFLLSTMLLFGLVQTAFAEGITPEFAANGLNKYELFRGTGNGYELDRMPTRLEALVMIIRLIGVEWWVDSEDWENYEWYTPKHSFTDVPEWGAKYVHCGVYLGLTNGISKYEFGSNQPITAAQYITLILRALRYDDSIGYYSWDNPWELSDHIGLTDGQYPNNDAFSRGDMAVLSYSALSRYVKNSPDTLYYSSFIFQKQDNPEFPEEFWGNGEYMQSYKYDGFADVIVGETSYCSVTYAGTEEKELTLEIQDPSIASIEFIDTQYNDFREFDGPQSVRQSFEVTGLRPGKTFVKITFAGDPDSHAIAFLDVQVSE